MARYTSAYSSFINRMVEVEILRKSAFKMEAKGATTHGHEISALCRGAVVLLCSHLEAYIKEVGELAIDSLYNKSVPKTSLPPRFFYHVSKKLIKEIQDTSNPEKIANKVLSFLQTESIYWPLSDSGLELEVFTAGVPADRFSEGFSTPKFDQVQSYFSRFGYTHYKRDIVSSLARNFQPTINMVDHMVDLRNSIAHGDPTATKTSTEVKEMMIFVKRYCVITDSAFASWWKSKFCAIR